MTIQFTAQHLIVNGEVYNPGRTTMSALAYHMKQALFGDK